MAKTDQIEGVARGSCTAANAASASARLSFRSSAVFHFWSSGRQCDHQPSAALPPRLSRPQSAAALSHRPFCLIYPSFLHADSRCGSSWATASNSTSASAFSPSFSHQRPSFQWAAAVSGVLARSARYRRGRRIERPGQPYLMGDLPLVVDRLPRRPCSRLARSPCVTPGAGPPALMRIGWNRVMHYCPGRPSCRERSSTGLMSCTTNPRTPTRKRELPASRRFQTVSPSRTSHASTRAGPWIV